MKRLFILLLMIGGSLLANAQEGSPCETGDLFPNEEDCTQYYECADGEFILRTCPGGLYFNSVTQMCDYPENADCDLEDAGGSGTLDNKLLKKVFCLAYIGVYTSPNTISWRWVSGSKWKCKRESGNTCNTSLQTSCTPN